MPVRSSRSTRTPSHSTRPPSRSTRTPSTTARASSAAPQASSSINIPPEGPDNELRTQVCAIFHDAQRNTASHRKLAIKLRKLLERCCNASPDASPFTEETFHSEFSRCVLRVMPVRKSEGAGDRTIRFISFFLRHAHDKELKGMGAEDPEAQDQDVQGRMDAGGSVMPETRGGRLTSHMMEVVVPLLTSKDKFVRYRSTQLICNVVNTLDAIDDETFQKLHLGLLKRIRDKEAMVRAQAVLGLSCLISNDKSGEYTNSDENETDSGSSTDLLQKLLSVLQNDPSPDVRRSLLINLPIVPTTLLSLLDRARDQDAATRRAVYSRLLPALGDFRHLSLAMREKLLRWGLRDRDEMVRKSAHKLFRERWIEDCSAADEQEKQGPGEPSPLNFDGLLELLERIDVVNSGVEDGVAIEAMRGFWEGRPDYREAVVFDDKFWETLSAESAFMARSYNDFCRNAEDGQYESLIDEKLPEVTKLAFYLERYMGVLIDAIKRINSRGNGSGGDEVNEEEEEEEEEGGEDTVEKEFIVEQLLHIAITLDYSDEVGRRKMFALLRQTLASPELPDEVTKLVVNVLRDISAPGPTGESEFCSVVLEAVADVHDTVADDPPFEDAEESFHSARSEVDDEATPMKEGRRRGKPELSEEEANDKAVKEILVNMKCLHIVQCMLTNVCGNLQKNVHLVSMLNNLVVPAVRSHEMPVRVRGLVCLGLCSLLDKPLAEENLKVFTKFFAKGNNELQITALHILTDILNTHGAQLVQSNPDILRVYIKALRMGSRAPEVQATATVAVSKLLLGRAITDPDAAYELLKSLVVAYFDPSSAENQSVRQALNYFLPVFCYTRSENQDLMRSVALDALHALFNIRDGLEDDDVDVDEDMVSLTAIGACLVDWTDPRKCYSPGIEAEAEKKLVNGDVHLQFAQDILARLRGSISREEKKIVAGLLGKLHVSAGSSPEKIREVYAEVCGAVEEQLIPDTTGKNALYKIHVSLGKIFNAMSGREPKSRRASRSTSVVSSVLIEDRVSSTPRFQSVIPDVGIKGEETENTSREGTVIHTVQRDSLVEELLEEEED